MSRGVLLSIKPQFAEKIFDGQKQYEFRRVIFRDSSIKRIYVYASAPISKVIGEFQVAEILKDQPLSLWRKTSYASGISESYFSQYFSGKDTGYAIKIEDALKYDSPLDLKEKFNLSRPPQSFAYVDSV